MILEIQTSARMSSQEIRKPKNPEEGFKPGDKVRLNPNHGDAENRKSMYESKGLKFPFKVVSVEDYVGSPISSRWVKNSLRLVDLNGKPVTFSPKPDAESMEIADCAFVKE